MARSLTQGVDVWLNTPRRPQEASGTSGMSPFFKQNFEKLIQYWSNRSAAQRMVVTKVVSWDDVIGYKQAWNVLAWFATLVTMTA